MAHEWHMPDWWFRGKQPPDDNAYFENLSRVIFQAGLNWQVVDGKWPAIKDAFCDFNIKKASALTDKDVVDMLKKPDLIRHKGKIQATIQNAKNFLLIERTYGSFPKYLASLEKSDNYAAVIKDLKSKFRWVGDSTAATFLFTVNENINVWGHE